MPSRSGSIIINAPQLDVFAEIVPLWITMMEQVTPGAVELGTVFALTVNKRITYFDVSEYVPGRAFELRTRAGAQVMPIKIRWSLTAQQDATVVHFLVSQTYSAAQIVLKLGLFAPIALGIAEYVVSRFDVEHQLSSLKKTVEALY